ncbi:MAG: sugar transferase, partial [Saprospiraceae bacterium]|nr:sugar transferase [Saprospiraceae bacterium]
MMMNWYSFGKRLLDILLASLALILLLPLLLITMIVLRFTAEREVFYLQTRMARYNKTFRIWKFATMLKDSPNMGTGTITLRNDPRVTAFGRILRKTKINELPQLFNVLLGDMSIVGP